MTEKKNKKNIIYKTILSSKFITPVRLGDKKTANKKRDRVFRSGKLNYTIDIIDLCCQPGEREREREEE